jgi:hypothetical protein
VVTVDGLDRVLSYLPVFERQPSELYKVDVARSPLDPYSYAAEVNQFIQTLYQEGFVTPFDWMDWQQEANAFMQHPERVQTTDLETIQKLLTAHVRAERFNSGHLAQMIQTGHILTILNRLAGIRAQMALESPVLPWRQRVEVIQGDITPQDVE